LIISGSEINWEQQLGRALAVEAGKNYAHYQNDLHYFTALKL
jgi:hypothetical protein